MIKVNIWYCKDNEDPKTFIILVFSLTTTMFLYLMVEAIINLIILFKQ